MLLHSLLSAGTYVVAKRALVELSAFELGLVRFTLAGLVYGLLLWRVRVRLWREDLWPIVCLGFIAVPVNQGLFLAGLAYTSPGHAALLYALTPVFVFVIARARLGEGTSLAKLAGIVLAFAGVLVVLLARGILAFRGQAAPLLGDLMILVAVKAWAVYAVWGKPYAERYGAIAFTGFSLLFGSILYLPLGLLESRAGDFAALSAGGWGAVGYLVLITSVVCYVLFYWALARAQASRVAIWSNLQPVFTAILAWALHGERLTAPFLAGGAMVLAGVVLTERG